MYPHPIGAEEAITRAIKEAGAAITKAGTITATTTIIGEVVGTETAGFPTASYGSSVINVFAAMYLALVPNHALTPGLVRPDMPLEKVCHTVWHLDKRMVTKEMKQDVAEHYDMPWKYHWTVEFDHLIPRCLGGADDELNLWPETRAGSMGALVKDKLEWYACKAVCAGTWDLEETRQAFANDWEGLYRRTFPDETPSS